MSGDFTVVICTHHRGHADSPSCAAAGAETIAGQLQRLLDEAGLQIPLQRIECFGHCGRGPNLRIAPGGRFFHQLTLDQLPEVIAELQRLTSQ